MRERVQLLIDRHTGEPEIAAPRTGAAAREAGPDAAARGPTHRHRRQRALISDAAIRPERFARLVTLASILIDAGRAGRSSTPPGSARS